MCCSLQVYFIMRLSLARFGTQIRHFEFMNEMPVPVVWRRATNTGDKLRYRVIPERRLNKLAVMKLVRCVKCTKKLREIKYNRKKIISAYITIYPR